MFSARLASIFVIATLGLVVTSAAQPTGSSDCQVPRAARALGDGEAFLQARFINGYEFTITCHTSRFQLLVVRGAEAPVVNMGLDGVQFVNPTFIDDFLQTDPFEGDPCREETEVRCDTLESMNRELLSQPEFMTLRPLVLAHGGNRMFIVLQEDDGNIAILRTNQSNGFTHFMLTDGRLEIAPGVRR